MTVGDTGPAISKLVKCLPECPIRSYDARIPTTVKRISEYQQVYRGWPWQPIRQSYKPEPPKKTTDKQQPMQKKTSYAVDYASHPMQGRARVKKHKEALGISKKPLEKMTTYNMEFYAKQLPEFSLATEALRAVKKISPEEEPLTFEGETIYTLSYPAYEYKTIYEAKPAIITAKDNLDVPASGDIVVDPKTTVQDDFVPYQSVALPQPIRPKSNNIPTSEPIAKDTEYKERYIDPLKHLHLARIQKEVEINPKFEAITTAMADFTPPSIPLQQKPKIPADNIQRDIAPFNDETTSKMTYKEWPVMPPKHPIWAKKPVYKRRTGGFVTKSIYAKDFCDPHVVDRDLEIRPTKRDVNIITNKPGNRPFKYITTYCTDYKPTEGAKAPASYFVVEQYRPPVMPMAMETVQMADYKGHQVDLTIPIRHSSQHRDLLDTNNMTFVTTYNENFHGYRPKSCPSKIDHTAQLTTDRPKFTPIPKPDLSVLPRVDAYPIITPPTTPMSSRTPIPVGAPKTPRNTPEKDNREA